MIANIDEKIEKIWPEIVDGIKDLVAVRSVSSDKKQVAMALENILDLAKSWDLDAHSVLGGQVGEIEIGEGDETLGILVHVDVVSPGDESKWTSGPFEAHIDGNRFYGRGLLDDKGPAVLALAAMKLVKDSGHDMHKKVRMIVGTQEEVDWIDMDEYVKTAKLPDYGFTPDGDFPIKNIEKGYLDIRLDFRDESFEKEKLHIVSIEAGHGFNSVPEHAKAMLSTGEELCFEGASSHSAYPEKGENALVGLSHMIDDIDLANGGRYNLLRFVKDFFTQSNYGEKLGLYIEDEYYQGEHVHKTSIVPTMVLEDGLSLSINIRVRYGQNANDILARFNELSKEYGFIASITTHLPAIFVSKEYKLLKEMASIYEETTGLKNEFTYACGTSYAKAMENFVCWGPLMEGLEDTCHEPNEHMEIGNMKKALKMYSNLIYKVATSKESYR